MGVICPIIVLDAMDVIVSIATPFERKAAAKNSTGTVTTAGHYSSDERIKQLSHYGTYSTLS